MDTQAAAGKEAKHATASFMVGGLSIPLNVDALKQFMSCILRIVIPHSLDSLAQKQLKGYTAKVEEQTQDKYNTTCFLVGAHRQMTPNAFNRYGYVFKTRSTTGL